MVGIVIVSHSKKLAEGVRELAAQMVQGRVGLATAGGIDDPENPIGTDALKVFQAIESVYSDDGVLVLMDLGSALMSAELAVEMLQVEQQPHVLLTEAPLVEGALAAVVQADSNGTLEQVANEARGALFAKAAQLGVETADYQIEPQKTDRTSESESLNITLKIKNKMGLHARPAAQFVSMVARFESQIMLSKAGSSVNAKSINQVTTLGVQMGDEITVTAVGPDAEAALAAVQALADRNFGELDEAVVGVAKPPAKQVASDEEWAGIAASPGIAIGPVFQYRPQIPEIVHRSEQDSDAEWARLQKAVFAAQTEIDALYEHALSQIGQEDAAIFQAHRLFLEDPDLMESVKKILEEEKINVESAWQRKIAEAVEAFRGLSNPYMQARAADLEDVGNRVLRHLTGITAPTLKLASPVVLVAADLTPSDTAQLDREKVLGICTELGGSTSHSAILSRALGIPAVVGAGPQLATLADGQLLALNGSTGQLWTNLTAAQLTALEAEKKAWEAVQADMKALGKDPAVTKDGKKIEVAANIGGVQDTAVALEYGAEGVGLFRTEFLFMNRASAPSEAEQAAVYQEVVAAMKKRPFIFRTLDVGGDKPLPYVDLGIEENPFLGWRGIRFCLDTPDLFKPQLRAILRATVDQDGQPTNVKMMFPMVGSLEELRRARAMLDEVMRELESEEYAFDPNVEIGIMIEVPAAVSAADILAKEVDFFSIGTNDLTQYVMAADRGNAKVAQLAQALQPAVLRMIQQAAAAAHDAGIWVGMCGELAGNALATPILLGLGLDELSMSSPSIPGVKAAVCQWSLADAQEAAAKALQMETAVDVQTYLESIQK